VHVAAWIGQRGQEACGIAALVGELRGFPSRIRDAGEIAVALHRQGRTLAEGRDDGRRVGAAIAFDGGHVTVTIRDGREAVGTIIGELEAYGAGQGVESAQVSSSAGEDVELAAVLSRNEDIADGRAGQGRAIRSCGAALVAIPEIECPAPDVVGMMDAQAPSSEAETAASRRPITLVVKAQRRARRVDDFRQRLGFTPDDGPTLLTGATFWRFIGPDTLPMHRVTIGGRAGAASRDIPIGAGATCAVAQPRKVPSGSWQQFSPPQTPGMLHWACTLRTGHTSAKTTNIPSVPRRIDGRSVGASRITVVSISRIFAPFSRRGGILKIIAAIEHPR